MTAEQLLAELDRLGVSVRQDGPDHLTLKPADRIPAELVPALRAAKPELLALVAARSTWTDPASDPSGSVALTDPRGDLGGSAEWNWLLARAEITVSSALAGVLHGFRCLGAQLTHDRGSWRLVPTIDQTERISLWHSREAWERDRAEWLLPFKTELSSLLAQLPPPTRPQHRQTPSKETQT